MSTKNNTKKDTVSKSVDKIANEAISLNQDKQEIKAEAIPNATVKKVEFVNKLGNVPDTYTARLKIRPRRGWHQYWAAPGEDYERCMASGAYTQVRMPTDEQKRNGYEPGEENGEVLKIVNTEGKIELVALECRMEDYEEYLHWMEQESTRRYMAIKEDYYNSIESLNSKSGSRGKHLIAGEMNKNGEFKPF